MVIPLGSVKPGATVNRNDIDLGVIKEINDVIGEIGVKSIAKISGMREKVLITSCCIMLFNY